VRILISRRHNDTTDLDLFASIEISPPMMRRGLKDQWIKQCNGKRKRQR